VKNTPLPTSTQSFIFTLRLRIKSFWNVIEKYCLFHKKECDLKREKIIKSHFYIFFTIRPQHVTFSGQIGLWKCIQLETKKSFMKSLKSKGWKCEKNINLVSKSRIFFIMPISMLNIFVHERISSVVK